MKEILHIKTNPQSNRMYQILSPLSFGSHLVIQNGIQTIDSPSWGDVFSFLQSKHFHAEDSRTTPHAESLWEHLVTCGELSYVKAQALGFSEHECKKAYFAGFLHDIGKPGTLTRSITHLAFKGHGLVGGAILENAWTPQLGEVLQFSSQDWADISMLTDVHMCGYFPHQTDLKHAVGFQILPESVKRLLPCLRWGDMASMQPISNEAEKFQTDPKPDEERFMAILQTALNIQQIVKERRCGILIQLCGPSSAGKTTLARWLKDQLTDRGCIAHILSRDIYTVREALRQGCCTTLTQEVWAESGEKITPEIYQVAYRHYVNSGKAYSDAINFAMKADIQAGLQRGHIIILDTLMTMYPFALKNALLPECAEKAFRLNLWVHRNTLITEEEAAGRLGMTLEEQLSVHSSTGPAWNPFPSKLAWHSLISATESA